MSTVTTTAPASLATGHEPVHVGCCIKDVALCGVPVDDLDPTLPDANCVVCLDLEEHAHHQCPVRPTCVQWEEP